MGEAVAQHVANFPVVDVYELRIDSRDAAHLVHQQVASHNDHAECNSCHQAWLLSVGVVERQGEPGIRKVERYNPNSQPQANDSKSHKIALGFEPQICVGAARPLHGPMFHTRSIEGNRLTIELNASMTTSSCSTKSKQTETPAGFCPAALSIRSLSFSSKFCVPAMRGMFRIRAATSLQSVNSKRHAKQDVAM